MSLGGGDSLARGMKSFTFPSNSHIEQSKWDAIFGPRETELKTPTLPEFTPLHKMAIMRSGPKKKKKNVRVSVAKDR